MTNAPASGTDPARPEASENDLVFPLWSKIASMKNLARAGAYVAYDVNDPRAEAIEALFEQIEAIGSDALQVSDDLEEVIKHRAKSEKGGT